MTSNRATSYDTGAVAIFHEPYQTAEDAAELYEQATKRCNHWVWWGGKTALMVAFGSLAEQAINVHLIFWEAVDGGTESELGSLEKLVEQLTGVKVIFGEQRNPNVVIAALRTELANGEVDWSLCLDNADDEDVSGILND